MVYVPVRMKKFCSMTKRPLNARMQFKAVKCSCKELPLQGASSIRVVSSESKQFRGHHQRCITRSNSTALIFTQCGKPRYIFPVLSNAAQVAYVDAIDDGDIYRRGGSGRCRTAFAARRL